MRDVNFAVYAMMPQVTLIDDTRSHRRQTVEATLSSRRRQTVEATLSSHRRQTVEATLSSHRRQTVEATLNSVDYRRSVELQRK